MEIHQRDNRSLIVREASSGAPQYVMRVWVDEESAFRTEPVCVEFVDYRMAADDASAGYEAVAVVRWGGQLIVAPDLADAEAFWLGDADTLREDIERLARSYERYVREPLRGACTFVAFVMGDAEEGEL